MRRLRGAADEPANRRAHKVLPAPRARLAMASQARGQTRPELNGSVCRPLDPRTKPVPPQPEPSPFAPSCSELHRVGDRRPAAKSAGVAAVVGGALVRPAAPPPARRASACNAREVAVSRP